jgi:ABC-type bacteriocin/lantibiotic exporter with double-glycine peptidase domain
MSGINLALMGVLWAVNQHVLTVSTENLDDYEAKVQVARKACGPVALCYCLRKCGVDVSLEQILHELPVGEDGVAIAGLVELSASFGVSCRAVRSSPEGLASLPIPSILIVDSTHCVVYEGVAEGGEKAFLFEPALAKVQSVPTNLLRRSWKGEAIIFGAARVSYTSFLMVLVGTVMFVCATRCGLQLLLVAYRLRAGRR